MELKRYKLGEIAEIQTGPFGSQLHNEDYVQIGTPIVTVEHLGQKEFTTQNLPLVSDADKERLHKYVLRRNDIVFSRVGTVDRCSFVTQKEDGWLFSGRCLRVRPQSNIYAEYLYYLLCTNSIRDYIRSKAVGATMPSLNTELLFNIPITLPSLSDQRRIASVLSNLDRKIALNRQINTNLEALARQLYDYWFVQFDFPDANGKPYKSSGGKMTYNEKLKRHIPNGWEVKTIDDLAQVYNGATPSTTDPSNYGGNIIWITPKDLSDQQNKFIIQGDRNITEKGYNSCSTHLLPINSILMSSRAPIGLFSIAKTELCTNQGFKSFVPKSKVLNTYLYYYLLTHKSQIEQLGTGTTFKEVSRDDVLKLLVLKPTKELLSRFEEFSCSVNEKQLVLQKQISSLTRQRDELLPLLMNGQVTVE